MSLVVDSYRFAAAGGLTDPTDIAGCTLWLDAADTATITDTAGAVSQWDDKSASALTFTPADTAPTTAAATRNSLNVLVFSGGRLASGSATILDASNASFTAFAVAKSNAAAVGGIVAQDKSVTSFRLPQMLRFTAGYAVESIRISNTSGISVVADTSGSIGADTWGVVSAVMDASSLEAFVNGTGDGSQSLSASYAGAHNVIVGQTTDGAGSAEQLTGSIAELVVYNTALDSTDYAAVGAYLADKWGL